MTTPERSGYEDKIDTTLMILTLGHSIESSCFLQYCFITLTIFKHISELTESSKYRLITTYHLPQTFIPVAPSRQKLLVRSLPSPVCRSPTPKPWHTKPMTSNRLVSPKPSITCNKCRKTKIFPGKRISTLPFYFLSVLGQEPNGPASAETASVINVSPDFFLLLCVRVYLQE